MSEPSLDLSHIRPATSINDTHTIHPTAKEASLQRILEEFDKMDDFQASSKKSKPVPQVEIPKKPKMLIITTPKERKSGLSARELPPSNILDTSVLSPPKSVKQEIKDLLRPRNKEYDRPEPTKLTVGALRGNDPTLRRNSFFPITRHMDQVEETNSPMLAPNALLERRSSGGGGDNQLKDNMNPRPHFRRQSSPNVFALLPSANKLPQIGKGLLISYPNPAATTPLDTQFSVPNGDKLPQSPKDLLLSPNKIDNHTRRFSSFTPRAGTFNAGYIPGKIDSPGSTPKIDSPVLAPINNDYLIKVLLNKGGNASNGGSSNDSPRSTGSHGSEKGDYKFAKVGSFSVFRKMVESEVVKDN